MNTQQRSQQPASGPGAGGWGQAPRPQPRRSAGKAAVGILAVVLLVLFGVIGAVELFVNQPRLHAIAAALAPSCSGKPVAGAGSPVAGVADHFVVLDMTGADHRWFGDVASELQPSSLADTELVVCVDAEETRTVVQTCGYSGGPDVTRFEVSRRVIVHDASTGQVLMSFKAAGEPRDCGKTESVEVTELVGQLDWGQVASRLDFLVRAGNPASLVRVTPPVGLAGDPLPAFAFLVTNTGSQPLSVTWTLDYPTSSAAATTDPATVEAVAPGETRLVTDWLPPLDTTSTLPLVVHLTDVEPSAVPETPDLAAARRAMVTLTPPSLPVDLAAHVASVRVHNASDQRMSGTVVVGFLAKGKIVAVAYANVGADPGEGANSALVELVGDPSSADEAIAQFESISW